MSVVGGGVAALTAAMFCTRLGLSTTVVSDLLVGGQIVSVDRVTNFPGFPDGVSGSDLSAQVEQQARDAGATFAFGEATALELRDNDYLLTTTDGDIASLAVIVATGSRLRTLGVPGEETLRGAGVSQCASCDGPFFIDRRVAVIGGGESAADEALVVADYASEVVIVLRDEGLDAPAVTIERVLAHPKISLRPHNEVLEILGDERVKELRLRDSRDGTESHLEVGGVFVFVGLQPNTALLEPLLELSVTGHVDTDPWMATATPGLFAAGDIRRHSPRQLVNAASDGATAALAAHRYIDALRRG